MICKHNEIKYVQTILQNYNIDLQNFPLLILFYIRQIIIFYLFLAEEVINSLLF